MTALAICSLVVAVLALFVAGKAYVYALRAATAETNRRRVARLAGAQGLPGLCYMYDADGGTKCVPLVQGEAIPAGYRYTPAEQPARNGSR